MKILNWIRYPECVVLPQLGYLERCGGHMPSGACLPCWARDAPSRRAASAPGLQWRPRPAPTYTGAPGSAALPARPCHELLQMCRRVVMRREHAPAGQGDSLKVRGRPYTDPRAVADLTFLVPADHKTIILYRWRHFIIPAGVRFGATFIWVRFGILRSRLSLCYRQLW